MGSHDNIGYGKFPRQGGWLKRRVEVCFNYDTSKTLLGEVVRDDREEPHQTIIRLDNGNYLLAGECMFHLLPEGEEGVARDEPSDPEAVVGILILPTPENKTEGGAS